MITGLGHVLSLIHILEPGDSQKVAVAFALDDRYAPVQLEIANLPLTEEARPTHPGQLEKIDITLNPAD